MIDSEIRSTIDGNPTAHLATLMPDGSPHSVPVWVGMRGDRIAIQTGPGSQKARNLRRDPRLAISLTPPDDPFVSIYLRGQVAEWLEGDEAWLVVDELAAKYIGAPYPRDQERVVALVDVAHAGSFNPR
jgi:PPOX class probable F420-dependent enzyme